LLEVAIEMGETVLLDALGMIAQGRAVGKRRVTSAVAGQQRFGEPDQRRLQARVVERLPRRAKEVVVLVLGVVHRLIRFTFSARWPWENTTRSVRVGER